MSGSGNDFVVIDHREPFLAPGDLPDFARAVCRRGVAIGADGVVLIEDVEDDDLDFRWRYLNADGSDGEMCGNGAMCGARFAAVNGIASSPVRFLTPDGVITAEIDAPARPQVRIAMTDPGPVRCETIAIEGTECGFNVLNTGVPHAVTVVDNVDALDFVTFDRIGRFVRRHDAVQPAGANVDIVHRIDGQTIRMRTYERGVEAETLACGTGAVASAIVAARQELVAGPPVTVITSSGRPLTVRWTETAGGITDVWLGGEARIIATGMLHPDGWIA